MSNSMDVKKHPVKIVIRYMRADEWLVSKVIMMMGILLSFAFLNNTALIDLCKESVAFFLFVSMFLAVSYVSNDYSDIEVDRKAGKIKIIACMPKWAIFASIIAMILLGSVPVIFISSNRILCLIFIFVTYILGLAYSTLGLRFKEKGVAGLIECSFAQKCMPLFMIAVLEDCSDWKIFLLAGWCILAFVDGLRYILIHQTIDLENDIKSGVNTFVLEKRIKGHNILLGLLIADIVICIGVLFPVWIGHPFIMGIGAIVNFIMEYCIYYMLNRLAGKDWLVTFDSVPMEAFLNMFMPLLVGLSMAMTNPWMLMWCALVILICGKAFMVKVKMAMITINVKRGRG